VENPKTLKRLVGRRIAELRRLKGITQEEMAELLDVGSRYVSRAERGENLTLETLAKIANGLGVPARQLLDPPSKAARKVRPGRPRKGA
jgi:transcriptional regulator with XRE-family HTH domain